MNVVTADGETNCGKIQPSPLALQLDEASSGKTIELDGEVFELTSPRAPCDVTTCRFCYKVLAVCCSACFSMCLVIFWVLVVFIVCFILTCVYVFGILLS